MKILFISDLHIGDGSRADDFKNPEDLMQWIEDIDPDKIYLVGDIYELWQFKRRKIEDAHPIFTGYLTCAEFHWIRGNHDYTLLGPLTEDIITDGRKKVLVSHGFQNDKLMTSPFSRALVWLLGQTLERIFPNIDNETGYKTKKSKKSRTVRNTRKYAKSMFNKGYDIVICGHDHKIKVEYIGRKVYANCGSCQKGKCQGILLDTFTNKIKMIRS